MSYTELSRRTCLAAKNHRCVWCGESIDSNTIHQVITGVDGGFFQESRYHEECMRGSNEYWSSGHVEPDEGFFRYSFYRGTPILDGEDELLAAYLFGQWEGEVAE